MGERRKEEREGRDSPRGYLTTEVISVARKDGEVRLSVSRKRGSGEREGNLSLRRKFLSREREKL